MRESCTPKSTRERAGGLVLCVVKCFTWLSCIELYSVEKMTENILLTAMMTGCSLFAGLVLCYFASVRDNDFGQTDYLIYVDTPDTPVETADSPLTS